MINDTRVPSPWSKEGQKIGSVLALGHVAQTREQILAEGDGEKADEVRAMYHLPPDTSTSDIVDRLDAEMDRWGRVIAGAQDQEDTVLHCRVCDRWMHAWDWQARGGIHEECEQQQERIER